VEGGEGCGPFLRLREEKKYIKKLIEKKNMVGDLIRSGAIHETF